MLKIWTVPISATTWLGKTKRRLLRVAAFDEWDAQNRALRRARNFLTAIYAAEHAVPKGEPRCGWGCCTVPAR